MGFSIYFFSRNPFHYFALLVILILSFYVCMDYGVLPIFFTALILIIPSSVILTFSNPKMVKSCQTESICSIQIELPKQSVVLSETQTQVEEEDEEIDHESSIGPSPDSYSESDSIIAYSPLTSDQESEIDWPDSGNLYGHFLASSDGTISDEESLIEIVLPSGQFLASPYEEEEEEERDSINDLILEMKKKKKMKSPMELSAEMNYMNEEDNLIEIDISIGSIKV
ncbi:uncharacterized protein LOC124910222 [Impatiens glandulifera]|uniref:uncharacterized protein LOC124910222 n=1 Tax=Impatiens glandulifera TaxID=253017 RepID=UPI001FB0FA40|nr:uncharacterized protein LOC124910222 [Impatiens glandulifera]